MGRLKKSASYFTALVFFCYFLAGCGRGARDSLVRIFFDGVPPANEEKGIALISADTQTDSKAQETLSLYLHPPFQKNQCDSCHESKYSQQLTLKGKDLCFSCHDDFTKNKEIVHYPAAEGACTDCHNPHQSVNRFFLEKTPPEICFDCHEQRELKVNPAHQGGDSCTDCHNPHASDQKRLLK